MVAFTDMRGTFPHKRNIALEHGWLLDLRAYVHAERANRNIWKDAKDDGYDDYAEKACLEANLKFQKTKEEVSVYLKTFERNKQGAYVVC